MTTASLQLDYVSADKFASQTAGWWHTVLGVVGFEGLPSLDDSRIPVTASMTPTLGNAGKLCEVWRVTGGRDLQSSNGMVSNGRVHYRYSDQFLFGFITLDEGDFREPGRVGVSSSGSAALQRATATAYQEIFDMLKKMPHRHLLRVWNYLPEINRESDGDERYRHFNSARRAAFQISGQRCIESVPAASALGSPAGSPISIYFLASCRPPQMIENPRQTSAYYYPPKFGRHSPIFSRACILPQSAGTNLFVSGTASIVGHETLHHGDVKAQTRETLVNICAVLGEANRMIGSAQYSLEELKFKVYVRRAADLGAIAAAVAETVPRSTPIVYLQADVCREDLLVEIEAAGEIQGVG